MRVYVKDAKDNILLETKSFARVENFVRDNGDKYTELELEEVDGSFSMSLDKDVTSRDILEAYKSFYKFV